MAYEIIDKEHCILSVPSDCFPDDMKNHFVVLYLPKSDVVVVNDGMPELTSACRYIADYMDLDDTGREEYGRYIANEPNDFGRYILHGIAKVLDEIIEVRRKEKVKEHGDN